MPYFHWNVRVFAGKSMFQIKLYIGFCKSALHRKGKIAKRKKEKWKHHTLSQKILIKKEQQAACLRVLIIDTHGGSLKKS